MQASHWQQGDAIEYYELMPLLDDYVQHDDDDDDDDDDNDDEHGYARRCNWILGTHAIARWLCSASWCWSRQCFMNPRLDDDGDDDEQVDAGDVIVEY